MEDDFDEDPSEFVEVFQELSKIRLRAKVFTIIESQTQSFSHELVEDIWDDVNTSKIKNNLSYTQEQLNN